MIKNVVVVSKGKYPISSWGQRIRMFQVGFKAHNVNMEYIIPFPAPTFDDRSKSEHFVHFMLKPIKKRKRNLLSVFRKIYGTLKGSFYLLGKKNVDIVLMPGMDFVQGLLFLLVVRLKKIKLYAEIADENGKKYLEEKPNLVEILAKYNQELYERFILSKCDRVYIFTDYLEKKISSRIDNKRIYRTVPSIIDITSFNSQKKNNILEINQANIAELKRNDRIKITYAGACNRTNGLEFFLRCFSNVIKQKDVNVKIFFFFGYGNVDKVKAICNELDISDYVHIFSAVFPKFIPSIYHHSDILVLPEHGDVVADAGFPGKTAEYLASGKAIIATDFSDLSKYLINGYNAMICDRGDSNRYSENLLSLLLGENLRKTIGKNAYQTALNKFNVKSAMTAYLN